MAEEVPAFRGLRYAGRSPARAPGFRRCRKTERPPGQERDARGLHSGRHRRPRHDRPVARRVDQRDSGPALARTPRAGLHAGPPRPEPAGPPRALSGDRRRPQVHLQGGLESGRRRQVSLRPRTDDRLRCLPADLSGPPLRTRSHRGRAHLPAGGDRLRRRDADVPGARQPRGLRPRPRRLQLEQQVVADGRHPGLRPDGELRAGADGRRPRGARAGGLAEPLARRRPPDRRLAARVPAGLERLHPAAWLPGLPGRGVRGDQPHAVRPAGGRVGAGRRLPHRVRRPAHGAVLHG